MKNVYLYQVLTRHCFIVIKFCDVKMSLELFALK